MANCMVLKVFGEDHKCAMMFCVIVGRMSDIIERQPQLWASFGGRRTAS